jgi:DNA-binding beta-propeller fold protein YncE
VSAVLAVLVVAVVAGLVVTRYTFLGPAGGTGHSGRPPAAPGAGGGTDGHVLAGMPPVFDPHDVYSADRAGNSSLVAQQDAPLVYVPEATGGSVVEIDPSSHRIVRRVPVGAGPGQVVPSWDLRTLWVTSAGANTLTPIDPRTGAPGRPVAVPDPHGLYFTPNGRYAIVVAPRLDRLDFRAAHSMAPVHALAVPRCPGLDALDFAARGTYLIASCSGGSRLVKVDVASQRVVGTLQLPPGSVPGDVRLSPSGTVFYVADAARGGVWRIDGASLAIRGFVPTGPGAKGLVVGRDSRNLYVTNRGSVSVLDLATGQVSATWALPGATTAGRGSLSADGKVLWLAGAHHGVVDALDSATGRLLATVPVGGGPRTAAVWPQPGRYSLGPAGLMR